MRKLGGTERGGVVAKTYQSGVAKCGGQPHKHVRAAFIGAYSMPRFRLIASGIHADGTEGPRLQGQQDNNT
jgi:hypothetical protein